MANTIRWLFYLAASAIGLVMLLASIAFIATAGLVVGGIALIALAIWLVAVLIKSGVENRHS